MSSPSVEMCSSSVEMCKAAMAIKDDSNVGIYFSYNEIHKLIKSGCEKLPSDIDYILAIAGGGLIPARIMRRYTGLEILVVSMKLYDSNDEISSSKPKTLQWLDEKTKKLIKGKHILIVDEVDDSRLTLEHCVEKVRELNPRKVTAFVVHSKKREKKGVLKNVDLIAAQVTPNKWLNYPWETDDIDEHTKLADEQKRGIKKLYKLC